MKLTLKEVNVIYNKTIHFVFTPYLLCVNFMSSLQSTLVNTQKIEKKKFNNHNYVEKKKFSRTSMYEKRLNYFYIIRTDKKE